MEKLHPKAVWLFFFQSAIGGLVFALFFVFPLLLMREQDIENSYFPVILFYIFYLIFDYIWSKLTYRFFLYQITDDYFKMEQGVIRKRYVSIPYERIQNIEIHRGIIARLLGLSDLRIQTAGYGGMYGKVGHFAEGNLPGLEREKAEQLREELIAKVKGTKQGL